MGYIGFKVQGWGYIRIMKKENGSYRIIEVIKGYLGYIGVI